MTQQEVLEILYGDGAWEVSKELTDRQKRGTTAVLSGIGATAGAAGLGYAGHKFGGAASRAYKLAPAGKKLHKLRHAVKVGAKEEKLGTALVPLEAAGLAGEVAATKILHGDVKHKRVHKSLSVSDRHLHPISKGIIRQAKNTMANVEATSANAKAASMDAAKVSGQAARATSAITPKRAALGGLTALAALGSAQFGASYTGARQGTKSGMKAAMKPPKPAKPKGTLFKLPRPARPKQPQGVGKSVDFEATVEISKADDEKQQVFGWASIITKDGVPVLDLQDDIMSIDTIEKAAYQYVQKSRKGGNQHQKTDDGPLHVSDLIESFVVTDEKKRVLGLPDDFPTGWFTGFQIHDDATWAAVKDGRLPMLSIHGTGRRTEREMADV